MRHSTLSHEYRVIKNLISQILWWQQTQHFQQKKINFPHLHSVFRAVVCMCCAFVQRHLGVLGSVYTENTLFIHHSNICPSKWISKLFCICSRKMLDVMTMMTCHTNDHDHSIFLTSIHVLFGCRTTFDWMSIQKRSPAIVIVIERTNGGEWSHMENVCDFVSMVELWAWTTIDFDRANVSLPSEIITCFVFFAFPIL